MWCLRQLTSRRSWQTSSPSYWTARRRSKASTTLPSCPPTPPWSCASDSAASWPPLAGCPPREDELGGSARRLSRITGPTAGRHLWTSLNPCLPYQSRGHSLLAVIPLLLFCCYRFYHYKYYFTFILSKTQWRWGRTIGRGKEEKWELTDKRWQSCSCWKPSTFCFIFTKEKKKTSLKVFHSLLLLLLLFDSSFPDHAHSPFLKHPSLREEDHPAALPPVWYSITTFCFIFLRK